MSYNIYEIASDGSARWSTRQSAGTGTTPEEALMRAHREHQTREFPYVVVGKTYFVVDPESNPQGAQCLFQLEQAGVVARPVGL